MLLMIINTCRLELSKSDLHLPSVFYSRSKPLYFSSTWQEKNSQVRRKVKDAVVWDMTEPKHISGSVLESASFDVVTACFCLSSACSTIEKYTSIIKNIRLAFLLFKDIEYILLLLKGRKHSKQFCNKNVNK